jgi:hypothetical protein
MRELDKNVAVNSVGNTPRDHGEQGGAFAKSGASPALPSAPAVEDGATKGDIDRWRAAIPAAAKAMTSHLDVASSIASSAPVEGVEPVAWVSEGQLHAMSPDRDDDSASGRYLPMRRSEGGNFKFPLYPASAISSLQRLVDGIDDERRGALDLCVERNKQIQALEKEVVRLTALLAEADEVVKPFAEAAGHFVVPKAATAELFLESENGRLPISVSAFRAARRHQQNLRGELDTKEKQP